MTDQEKIELIQFLEHYVTVHKKDQIQRILSNRTRYVTVVLEDTYQSHNASAIIRSCEVLGLQDIHVVQDRNLFRPSFEIAKGATKWVDVYTHTSTSQALQKLKETGYTIAATVADSSAVPLSAIPLDHKIAFLFGTELKGLSSDATQQADLAVTIPMYGFTKSFNLSVSVAVCVHAFIAQLHASPLDWRLTTTEQLDLHLQWLRIIIPGAQSLEKEFFRRLSV